MDGLAVPVRTRKLPSFISSKGNAGGSFFFAFLGWKPLLNLLDFHSPPPLRHEAVSRLFEKGLTTEEVMGMSGHSQLFRYTHLRVNTLAAKLG